MPFFHESRITNHELRMFQLFLSLKSLQIIWILDPFLDVAAVGADEARDPHVEAGQVDGDAAPAVEHRRAALAGDDLRAAFRAQFIVLHHGTSRSCL